MRLRNVTGAIDHINNHHLVEQEPESYKGRWQEYFNNDHPIYIEIGMGKGDFIIENAKTYPNINFIGMEKYSTVILRAVHKVEQLESSLANLCLLRFDARDLLDIFAKAELSKLYLNFSDPWPKDRWAKRRLMHIGFLNKYKEILKTDALLQFKTDNDSLFDFALDQIEESAFEVSKMTRNLYHSEFLQGNIMTEYESKFVEEGKTINMVEIKNFVE